MELETMSQLADTIEFSLKIGFFYLLLNEDDLAMGAV
jgi:hypothetical protein